MSSEVVELHNAMRVVSGATTARRAFGQTYNPGLAALRGTDRRFEAVWVSRIRLCHHATKEMCLPSGANALRVRLAIRHAYRGISGLDVATIQMEVSYPVRFSSTLRG